MDSIVVFKEEVTSDGDKTWLCRRWLWGVYSNDFKIQSQGEENNVSFYEYHLIIKMRSCILSIYVDLFIIRLIYLVILHYQINYIINYSYNLIQSPCGECMSRTSMCYAWFSRHNCGGYRFYKNKTSSSTRKACQSSRFTMWVLYTWHSDVDV